MPTAVDPSLTDDGTTVADDVHPVRPARTRRAGPTAPREAYAQRCFDLLAQHAPNVKDALLALRGARAAGPASGSSGWRAARSSRASRTSTRWRSCARRPSSSRYATPVARPLPLRRRDAPGRRRDRRLGPQRRAARAARPARRADPHAPAHPERPSAAEGHSVHIGRRWSDRGSCLTAPAESDSRRAALNEPSTPEEPPQGVSRRSLLRRGGRARARRGRRRGLAGCENTTTPVAAAGGGGGGKGHPRRPDRRRPGRRRRASRSRAATTRSTLPAHRRRRSRLGEARARRRAADLQLRRLPQPGGHQGVRQAGRRQRPRHDVRDARRGVLEAQHRRPRVRRHLLDARPALAARRAQAHPAAELRADPEPAEERLAGAAQPVLRRRPALHGPLRRLHDRASAGATTIVDFDPSEAATAVGRASGTRAGRVPRQGRSCSTTRARRSGMALMRRGASTSTPRTRS